MKVAIIGGGIAGLSCAIELEKHGISPTIFEKRSYIGENVNFTALWLRNISKFHGCPIKYLKKNYDIDITPFSKLRSVFIKSPNEKNTVSGSLGYMFRRGNEPNSVENQLASKLKSAIAFNAYIELEDIKDEYENIVVATGDSQIAQKMNLWEDNFAASIRIGIVAGDFSTDCAAMWLNEDYSNKSYCYLVPSSNKEANLILITNNHTHHELDYYWNKFLKWENLNYYLIEENDIQYHCGLVRQFKIDNIYFAGNAAGLTDNLIGIGIFNSIESGILAARAIAEGHDYNKLIEPIFEDILKLNKFRKVFNTFDNPDFDKLNTFVGMPIIKQLIYRNPFFKLQDIAKVVRLNKHRK